VDPQSKLGAEHQGRHSAIVVNEKAGRHHPPETVIGSEKIHLGLGGINKRDLAGTSKRGEAQKRRVARG